MRADFLFTRGIRYRPVPHLDTSLLPAPPFIQFAASSLALDYAHTRAKEILATSRVVS